MKLNKSKEYWEKKIEREGDADVAAGSAGARGSASDLAGAISITKCDECGEVKECITLYGNVHYCRQCSNFGVGRHSKKPNQPCSHCGGNGYEP